MSEMSKSLTKPALTAVAALLLLAVTVSAQAQWKWRDKDGRVTVSDRAPPNDVPEKDILSKPTASRRALLPSNAPASAASAAAAASAPAGKTALEREVEARRKLQEQEAASKAKAEEAKTAALKAENCARARTQMASLESGQRIARMNDKGEREVLDDKGRAEETRQLREQMSTDCR